MFSQSRRDSLGGGVVPEFFRDLQKPALFSGEGGSSRLCFVFSGTRPHFSISSVEKSDFASHRVIFVGRDTHCLVRYARNKDFLLKRKLAQIAQIP